MGFFYWGEENNPAKSGAPESKPNYHKAPKQTIDPRTVQWANTPVSEKHVRRYEVDPNRYADDGDPFVVIGRDGVARGWNGKHRAIAAMRQGRMLRARVWDGR